MKNLIILFLSLASCINIKFRPEALVVPEFVEEGIVDEKTVDHKAGWNGTFDNRIMLTNGQGESGAIYVGNLYISDNN
jgi:hypothetical protein